MNVDLGLNEGFSNLPSRLFFPLQKKRGRYPTLKGRLNIFCDRELWEKTLF